MRYIWVLCAFYVALIAAPASAATATINAGSVSAYWDQSLSGFQLSGPGTQLVGEFYGGPAAMGFTPGTRADLNGSVTSGQLNHPFQEQVNGTTYSSVWIRFQFTFATQPMAIPPVTVDGAFASFSTPFTMTGQFSGYSDQAMTDQVFSVSLQGSGVASSLTMRSFTSPPQWVAVHSGAQFYGFTAALPDAWTSADVGAVGTTGISSFGNGLFFVAGAGADIWGAADSFQFVSQPFAADGAIIARVDGEETTSSFAKAGIMIRQTIDRSAAHVVLDVKPDGVVEFMTRSAAGGDTTFIASATVSARPWLKLSRSGSVVSAAVSTDGTTYTPLGSATLSGAALAGLIVTSHDTTILNQASFESVSVSASAPSGGGTLPISWTDGDVGAVGQAGSASHSGGTFSVSGAGADIWGPADAFHYAYTPMNSDGSIDVRVTRMDNTSPFAKAGIMLRDSLDAGSTHVILDVRPDGSIEFMTRSSPNGSTTFVASAQASFPVSLRLVRGYATANSIVVAYVLDSNSSWQQIGWTMVPLGPDTTIGLAVTSHDASVLNTAAFDQVHVVKNLLVESSFEGYTPPALGPPGWVSDNPLRKVVAVSDGAHPHNGYQYGLCSTQTFDDCGMYQEVTAPEDGNYVLTAFASADRSGGFIGANVNGAAAQSVAVDVRSPGNYGATPYSMRFSARAGDRLRVWMYSPGSPGYVAIDDVALVEDFTTP